MNMSIDLIKKLRAETGIGVSECQKALAESKGDIDKAKEILKKKGKEIAANKSARETYHGLVESYIHANGQVGTMVVIRCESDFVAKSESFHNLAREIAMQIAAMNPLYISEDRVPKEVIEKEKEIYREQLAVSDKSAEMIEKIVTGKLEKFYGEVVLLRQKWIKDDGKTIKNLIDGVVSQLGEKIEVTDFARFEI